MDMSVLRLAARGAVFSICLIFLAVFTSKSKYIATSTREQTESHPVGQEINCLQQLSTQINNALFEKLVKPSVEVDLGDLFDASAKNGFEGDPQCRIAIVKDARVEFIDNTVDAEFSELDPFPLIPAAHAHVSTACSMSLTWVKHGNKMQPMVKVAHSGIRDSRFKGDDDFGMFPARRVRLFARGRGILGVILKTDCKNFQGTKAHEQRFPVQVSDLEILFRKWAPKNNYEASMKPFSIIMEPEMLLGS